MSLKKQIREFIKTYTFNKYLSWILFSVLTIIGITRAFQQYYIFDVGKSLQHSFLLWHIPFNIFYGGYGFSLSPSFIG
jgi:hypothetical protein